MNDRERAYNLEDFTVAVTSPMCAFEVSALNQLQQEFDHKGISFFLLYTRESHPAEYNERTELTTMISRPQSRSTLSS